MRRRCCCWSTTRSGRILPRCAPSPISAAASTICRAALAFTVRTGEPGEHEPLLDELRREPGAADDRAVASLGAAAAAALVEAGARPEARERLRRGLLRATAGNPFLLWSCCGRSTPSETGRDRCECRAPGGGRGRGRLALDPRPAGAARTSTRVAVARAVAVLEPNAEARLVAALAACPPRCRRGGLRAPRRRAPAVGLAAGWPSSTRWSGRPCSARCPHRAARPITPRAAAPARRERALPTRSPRIFCWPSRRRRVGCVELRARPRRRARAAAPPKRRSATCGGRCASPRPERSGSRSSRELGVALLRANDRRGDRGAAQPFAEPSSDPVARAEIATEWSPSPSALRRPGGEAVAC